MPVIEFIGIPRAGKTTTAKYLEQNFPNTFYYPERHDLVPIDLKNNDFEYNYWYAKYCVETLKEALLKSGNHIIERGVIDHIIIGQAHFAMGWFTKTQLNKYLKLLEPYINKIDKLFVFMIPVEVSAYRANEMGKNVSKAVPYISRLYDEYHSIPEWFPSAIFLPETASLEELKGIVGNSLKL